MKKNNIKKFNVLYLYCKQFYFKFNFKILVKSNVNFVYEI